MNKFRVLYIFKTLLLILMTWREAYSSTWQWDLLLREDSVESGTTWDTKMTLPLSRIDSLVLQVLSQGPLRRELLTIMTVHSPLFWRHCTSVWISSCFWMSKNSDFMVEENGVDSLDLVIEASLVENKNLFRLNILSSFRWWRLCSASWWEQAHFVGDTQVHIRVKC